MAMATLSLVSACNQTRVTTTIAPARPVNATGINASIVLMPLADYSQGATPDRAARRQAKSLASLSHQITSLGIMPTVQEDVYGYLFETGLISPVQTSISAYDSSKWSDFTNSITESILEGGKSGEVQNIIGFSPETIVEIGKHFSAKYVLRGRIIEYNMREAKTYDPMRRGILPFFVDGTSTGLFGVARSDEYDLWHDTASMGALGALAGTNAGGPFVGGGMSYGANAAFWGGAAAGTAYLANKGGKVNEARVQLQLALQSTVDGKVIWTNRVEIAVAPNTAFDRSDDQHLMDKALEEASITLIDDMGRSVFGVEVPTANLMAAGASSPSLDELPPLPPLDDSDPFPPMAKE
jgi:hypothetical protein